MSRTRNYAFTLNNYTEEDYDRLVGFNGHKQIRYLIFGKEEGEKEHTPHLQGFISFYNAKTFEQTKSFLGDRYHIEQAKGTIDQNIAYCSKESTFQEFGEKPQQGARHDLKKIKLMIKQGKSMRDIYEEASSYQSMRMAEIGMKLKPLQPREKPKVEWYWGPTGSGKTREAWEQCGYEDTWVSNVNLDWVDGYDGQSNVIIDDFRASHCQFAKLLRILDRYPLKLPVKGGFVDWVPKRIIVTSTHSPYKCYKSEDIQENIDQLIRRIDEIVEFEKTI